MPGPHVGVLLTDYNHGDKSRFADLLKLGVVTSTNSGLLVRVSVSTPVATRFGMARTRHVSEVEISHHRPIPIEE